MHKILSIIKKILNRKFLLIFGICAVSVLILVASALVYADKTVIANTEGLIYSNIDSIPENKVGLILGTSMYYRDGLNPYFFYRIDAAVALYKAGKIKYIVVSGDNGSQNYNEPQDIKNELVKHGIPAERIFLDYAGFRTYDSVVRIEKIFGQTSFTVISQEFHNLRAVYTARRLGLSAIAFNAQDLDIPKYALKMRVREAFARVKVLIDLAFNKSPKFLGEKIEIPAD